MGRGREGDRKDERDGASERSRELERVKGGDRECERRIDER